MAKKKFKLEKISDLKPAKWNPRTISKEAFDGLGFSLDQFGDLSGITWNSRSGNIVSGHQRVASLKKKGAKFVSGALVTLDKEKFDVRIVDWEPTKEKAANVAANNPAISGTFDDSISDIVDEIQSSVNPEFFESLRLDDMVGDVAEERKLELKEWDASDLIVTGLFTISAPIDKQPEIRAMLRREFPDVEFDEAVIHGEF